MTPERLRAVIAAPEEIAVSRDELCEAIVAMRVDLERLRKHAKAMSDALIKVRPLGGSELFVRVGEGFYADPDYCGAAIEDLIRKLHEARVNEVRRARSLLERQP